MKDINGKQIEIGSKVWVEAEVTEMHETSDRCLLTLFAGQDEQQAPIVIRYPFNVRPDLVEVKAP